MHHIAAAQRRGFLEKRARREYDDFLAQTIAQFRRSLSRDELLAIGDAAVVELARRGESAPNEAVLMEEVDRQVLRRLQLPSFKDWRHRNGITVKEEPVVIGQSGERLDRGSPQARSILISAGEITDDLIRELAARPELLYEIRPEKFEELVATLLERRGARVSLTARTRDGGRDIIAQVPTPWGSALCFVECKRYAADRPVGVRPVRELLGVIANERITQGVLVTTSRFTREARSFRDKVAHQLTLSAYEDIVEWLRKPER